MSDMTPDILRLLFDVGSRRTAKPSYDHTHSLLEKEIRNGKGSDGRGQAGKNPGEWFESHPLNTKLGNRLE